jgi:hypothetical protein
MFEGNSEMPSGCCIMLQNSVSFSSSKGVVGRAVGHAADAWEAQLQRRVSALLRGLTPAAGHSGAGSRAS